MPGTILDRSKVFEQPFAYILLNPKVNDYCSYCLRRPSTQTHDSKQPSKLPHCAQCEFARFCNKECQKLAWRDHKLECARLKKCFPNLPLTEVLFMQRILDKLDFLSEHGDVHKWEKYRTFASLMTHEEDIRADVKKMEHFEKLYQKLLKFRGEEEVTLDRDTFLLTFCRTWINSHSIHTSAGHEIGIALDLGVSRYDHKCRPNCTLVFDGFHATLRPLTPNLNADDPKKAFISYIDVGRSRYQRQNDLKAKWYFDCECERCLDSEEDKLTSIQCTTKNCDEALIITEISEPMHIACPKCKAVTDQEHVVRCQQLMLRIPSNFNYTNDEEHMKEVQGLLDEAKMLLHPENIYFCRLQTAYYQLSGDDSGLLDANMQKRVYQNFRRCFPEADRHVGYQLLHLVKGLITEGRRVEATPYAFEAMTIFEICFGLDHPYYLQTLALWTYLDNGDRSKSDDQLLQLMNFNYNKPVNVAALLDVKRRDVGNELIDSLKKNIQLAQQTDLGDDFD